MEERHITEEISSEMFAKYQAKFKAEVVEIQKLVHQSVNIVSNPEKASEMALQYSKNLNEIWLAGEYQEKQRLQYLLFLKVWSMIRKMRCVELQELILLFWQS